MLFFLSRLNSSLTVHFIFDNCSNETVPIETTTATVTEVHPQSRIHDLQLQQKLTVRTTTNGTPAGLLPPEARHPSRIHGLRQLLKLTVRTTTNVIVAGTFVIKVHHPYKIHDLQRLLPRIGVPLLERAVRAPLETTVDLLRFKTLVLRLLPPCQSKKMLSERSDAGNGVMIFALVKLEAVSEVDKDHLRCKILALLWQRALIPIT